MSGEWEGSQRGEGHTFKNKDIIVYNNPYYRSIISTENKVNSFLSVAVKTLTESSSTSHTDVPLS